MSKWKNHSPEFKAKVRLEDVCDFATIEAAYFAELDPAACAAFGLPPLPA